MSDESYSFSTARVRLEEIVTQVRKKDTSLEKSLDLLEEGVRLANACTELIDHADWTVGGVGEPAEGEDGPEVAQAEDGDAPAEQVVADVTDEAADTAAAEDEEPVAADATSADDAEDALSQDASDAPDDEA
jgi:exodeoxyribonuclease VII small subunit